jgi:hypothetical protein
VQYQARRRIHTAQVPTNGVELDGVDNEHHLLFECSHVALVASRSKHMALFDGVSGVREWMAAAYKPELAATLGSCMQDMMHGLKTGLEGHPNVTPAS